MLKKIAHNSTIPALGSNQDLKPLQNLIAAEKAVLISLQKLSVDYSKASEALRIWSLSEGDDLEGILGASTTILNHFSSALSQYAAHGHSIRDQLKAIRTREESLDDLERRRRSVLRKAEDADKKLSKMGPENKHYPMQTDTLNRLREDIRAMDSDIMAGEAALGDYKRSATKVWMGLKFGGLVECCEKGMIAGEFGRLAIAEISEEITQPGLPRSFNYPQNKIENIVAEAYRGVSMVTVSTFPSSYCDRQSSDAPAFFISMPTAYGRRPPDLNRSSTLSSELQPPPTSNNGSSRVSGEVQPSQTSTLQDNNASYLDIRPFGGGSHDTLSHSSQQLGANEGAIDGVNVRSTGPHHQRQLSQGTVNSPLPQTLPLFHHLRTSEGAVDDFDTITRSAPPYQQQFSEKSANPSFSRTSSSSQQLGANEGAAHKFDASVRSAPPYQQRFSEGSASPSFSQAPGVNEGTMDNFGANVRSGPLYQKQQFSQGTFDSSFSQPFHAPPQLRVNEGAVDANVRSTPPPYQPQLSQGTVDSSFSRPLPSSQQLRVNDDTVDDFGAHVRSTGPPHQQQLSQGSVNSSQIQLRVNNDAMDDFGANVHSTGPADSLDTAEGRFATFPVRTRSPGSTGGYALQDPPSGLHVTNDLSFSASVADALHGRLEGLNSETKLSPRANRFNDGPQSSTNSEGTTRGFNNQQTNTWGGRSDSPLVSTTAPSLQVQVGAEFVSPRSNPPLEGSSRASTHSRSSQASEYHDALVAHISEDPENAETPTHTAIPFSIPPATTTTLTTTPALSAPNLNEEDSRHVRFGGVENVNQEIAKRVSLEKEQVANTRAVGPRDMPRTDTSNAENSPPHRGLSQPIRSTSRRIPPPRIDSWEEDENALNTSGAREISLDLEALKNNNQQNELPSQVDQRFQSVPTADVDRGRTITASTPRSNNQLPHPYADINPPGTYPHYSTPQPYVQAAYQTTPDSPTQSSQQQQKQEALDMRNTLPPRFQAYNNIPVEPQVPPRLRNPSSPVVNSVPPRFQTNYASQASAQGGLNL